MAVVHDPYADLLEVLTELLRGLRVDMAADRVVDVLVDLDHGRLDRCRCFGGQPVEPFDELLLEPVGSTIFGRS